MSKIVSNHSTFAVLAINQKSQVADIDKERMESQVILSVPTEKINR